MLRGKEGVASRQGRRRGGSVWWPPVTFRGLSSAGLGSGMSCCFLLLSDVASRQRPQASLRHRTFRGYGWFCPAALTHDDSDHPRPTAGASACSECTPGTYSGSFGQCHGPLQVRCSHAHAGNTWFGAAHQNSEFVPMPRKILQRERWRFPNHPILWALLYFATINSSAQNPEL